MIAPKPYEPEVTPPCRVCGSNDKVFVWPSETPEKTICVDCCDGFEDGHEYEYIDDEWQCKHCSDEPLADYFCESVTVCKFYL